MYDVTLTFLHILSVEVVPHQSDVDARDERLRGPLSGEKTVGEARPRGQRTFPDTLGVNIVGIDSARDPL